jgi:hypothetical protein
MAAVNLGAAGLAGPVPAAWGSAEPAGGAARKRLSVDRFRYSRGLHGTLAVERGATTHVVAQALGRRSCSTRNNRALTPRRGNDSPNSIAAEPCVTKKQ